MNKVGLFIFYFLGWLDATINLLASILCFYPKVEMSITWLVHMESVRVAKTSEDSNTKRSDMEQEANQKKGEAYSLDDGKDI